MKTLALLISLLPGCTTQQPPLTADERELLRHVQPGAEQAALDLYRYGKLITQP